jgi:hypothetical protein
MQPLKVWVDVIVIAFADQRQLEDIALNAISQGFWKGASSAGSGALIHQCSPVGNGGSTL